MADPVPEPAPPERPVLSPEPAQAWPPGPRRFQQPQEQRPFWHLESSQVVILLMVVVVVIMMVMFGLLVSGFVHAAHSAKG